MKIDFGFWSCVLEGVSEVMNKKKLFRFKEEHLAFTFGAPRISQSFHRRKACDRLIIYGALPKRALQLAFAKLLGFASLGVRVLSTYAA